MKVFFYLGNIFNIFPNENILLWTIKIIYWEKLNFYDDQILAKKPFEIRNDSPT